MAINERTHSLEVTLIGNAAILAIDEVSGLSLRLEVSRQHKQIQWSFDALYGATVVRPQLASWIAG